MNDKRDRGCAEERSSWIAQYMSVEEENQLWLLLFIMLFAQTTKVYRISCAIYIDIEVNSSWSVDSLA